MDYKQILLDEAAKVTWDEFKVIRSKAEDLKIAHPGDAKEIKTAMYDAMEAVKVAKMKEKTEHELQSIWYGYDKPEKSGFRHVSPNDIKISAIMKSSQLPIKRVYISDLGRDMFTSSNIMAVLYDISEVVSSGKVPGVFVRICKRCPDRDMWADILDLVKVCNGNGKVAESA